MSTSCEDRFVSSAVYLILADKRLNALFILSLFVSDTVQQSLQIASRRNS